MKMFGPIGGVFHVHGGVFLRRSRRKPRDIRITGAVGGFFMSLGGFFMTLGGFFMSIGGLFLDGS